MTEAKEVQDAIIAALRTVYDPEIPVNLYDLGLIYAIDLDNRPESSEAGGNTSYSARITMTLTTPNCPVAGTMPETVRCAVAAVANVRDVVVDLVWDPPWDQSTMSEEARFMLGMV